jgi:hypothetical protein
MGGERSVESSTEKREKDASTTIRLVNAGK